tara:strand:- start:506 stop:769 length:264 start_codon:yes stop_codon:yes gene_type:complete
MTKTDIQKLGTTIASELIRIGREAGGIKWITEDDADHAVGELARCITLLNLYEDREEYEKCAIMKVEIKRLQDILSDHDSNIQDDET